MHMFLVESSILKVWLSNRKQLTGRCLQWLRGCGPTLGNGNATPLFAATARNFHCQDGRFKGINFHTWTWVVLNLVCGCDIPWCKNHGEWPNLMFLSIFVQLIIGRICSKPWMFGLAEFMDRLKLIFWKGLDKNWWVVVSCRPLVTISCRAHSYLVLENCQRWLSEVTQFWH